MKEKVMDICRQAIDGKIGADAFYDKLSSVCDDTRTEDDLACLLEDVLMEMEMEHDGSGGAKAKKKIAAAAAERILEEIDNVC